MVKPPEIASSTPLQNIIIPRVVMKEGMLVLKVIIPLIKPMPLVIPTMIKKTITGCKPAFANKAKVIAAMAKTEPTERSNSPEIIRKAIPILTIPSSAAIVKIPAKLGRVKNCLEREEKIAKIIIKPIMAPNSRYLISWLTFFEKRSKKGISLSSFIYIPILLGLEGGESPLPHLQR